MLRGMLRGRGVELEGSAALFGGQTQWTPDELGAEAVSVAAGWKHFAVSLSDGRVAVVGSMRLEGDAGGAADMELFGEASGRACLSLACGLGFTAAVTHEGLVSVVLHSHEADWLAAFEGKEEFELRGVRSVSAGFGGLLLMCADGTVYLRTPKNEQKRLQLHCGAACIGSGRFCEGSYQHVVVLSDGSVRAVSDDFQVEPIEALDAVLRDREATAVACGLGCVTLLTTGGVVVRWNRKEKGGVEVEDGMRRVGR